MFSFISNPHRRTVTFQEMPARVEVLMVIFVHGLSKFSGG
jgi:hypothetical protein